MDSQDKEDLKKTGAVVGVVGAVLTAIAALAKDNKNGQKS